MPGELRPPWPLPKILGLTKGGRLAEAIFEADTTNTPSMLCVEDALGGAYDVASYRDAPPGLRLWGGATVLPADLEAVFPWLDWAYGEAKKG